MPDTEAIAKMIPGLLEATGMKVLKPVMVRVQRSDGRLSNAILFVMAESDADLEAAVNIIPGRHISPLQT